MGKKKYKRPADIETALHELVRLLAGTGKEYLPPERELAERFQVSRMTLRKALDKLAEDKVILRGGWRTKIVRNFFTLEDCGKILFVASGLNGVFEQPAVERLWNTLGPMLLRCRADVHLLLVEKGNHFEELRKVLEQANVVLAGGCGGEKEVIDFLTKAQQKKVVIGLLESYNLDFASRITFDNYAVGGIAAEALLEAGCKKVFAMWECCSNRDFAHRAQGFADKLVAHNMGGIESIFWVPRKFGSMSEALRCHLDWAFANDYDGVFLMSDESIGDIVGHYFKEGWIPSKLKLITVDGTRAAFRHNPPISCLDHATEAIASELLKQMQKVADGKFTQVCKTLPSTFYDNGTV